jgi:hypothetical protein
MRVDPVFSGEGVLVLLGVVVEREEVVGLGLRIA